jgi:hypothetical protein
MANLNFSLTCVHFSFIDANKVSFSFFGLFLALFLNDWLVHTALAWTMRLYYWLFHEGRRALSRELAALPSTNQSSIRGDIYWSQLSNAVNRWSNEQINGSRLSCILVDRDLLLSLSILTMHKADEGPSIWGALMSKLNCLFLFPRKLQSVTFSFPHRVCRSPFIILRITSNK